MSGFFSANVTSPFPDNNMLFDASKVALAGQTYQNNQLLMQGRQQALNMADMEQVSRAAAGLLSLGDENAMAAAYPRTVGLLQSQGVAMHAPSVFPGKAALQALVQMGTPSADLYKLQLGQQAGQGLIRALTPTDGTASTAPGTAPAAGGGGAGPAPFVGANLPAGVSADEDQLVRTVYGEARGEPVAGQQAVAHVIKTRMGLGKQGVQDVVFAPNQFEAWSDPKNRPGMEALDPNSPQYQAILNTVVRPVISGQAPDPTGGATNFYNPALQAQLGRSTPGFAQGNRTTIGNHEFYYGGYAPRTNTASAPATASAGGGGTTAPYTVASNVPVAPPGSTAAPDAVWDLPGAPAPDQPPAPATTATTPPAATTAPAQPAQPAPAPGTPAAVLAPPAPTPAAVPQMTTPHGVAVPAPPSAPALLSNGLTPQQWAVIQAEALRPGADLGQIAGQVMQLATSNRAALQQAWADTHPDLTFKETSTGAIALNPKTGQIVGSYTYQPNMQSRAVEGSASWDGSQWVPAVPGQPSVPGRWVYSGATRGEFQPAASQPATASFDLQKELYKRDTDQLPEYSTQNQQAAANQIRIQQMRELVDQISSGAGGAERANWANIADTLGWTDLAKRLVGMGGAAAAQEFAKYGLATAGAQERGDLGARGSLGAINLYKSANPGLELQPDANKKMLTAQLIAAQANRDYTQQAMDYVNTNSGQFLHGGTYTPLSHFDAEWAAARNPQIYAAAMSAINGDPWEKWTKALNMKTEDDVQRVIGIVRRADPTSQVMFSNGKPHAVGTGQ